MNKARKLLLVFPILASLLACQFLTQPIQQGENTVATAAAFATQAEDLATQFVLPVETPLSISTTDANLPGGNPFNPTGAPLDFWKEIPIMPAATAGDGAEGMYGYKVDATPEDIMDFYAKALPSFGWVQNVVLPYADGMGILVYGRGSNALTITIAEMDGSMLVLLNMQ